MNNNELRLKNVGEIVILKGFVNNKRKFKGKTFIDLRDREGITQLIVNQDTSNITKESVIKISGEVVKRIEFNKDISTGEVEVFVSDLEIISIAKQIPFEINKKIDINENLRLEYRYLDLRRKKMYENLLLKSKVKNSFINFLSKKRFLDVETPSLSKITPEGARDFIVPTRNKGKFFSLPQSPQIYKQLLMIGGIEKYFQFVKVFRDEDMRKDRQPEFTQLDMEMSFHTPEMIQKLIEKMFLKLGKDIKREIKTPFLKMDYLDAMERFGSDKPDLRFENEIKDVTNYFKKSFFKIAKMSESVKYIFIDKKLSNKQTKKLEETAKKNGAGGLLWAYHNNDNNQNKGPAIKFLNEEINKIKKDHNLLEGTIFLITGPQLVVQKSLGAIRIELRDWFNLVKDNQKLNFVWIVNWPLFEYDKDKKNFSAAHHPFTSPSDEFIDDFDVNKEKAKAKAYDLVLNGFEIGGGSVRIFDMEVQKRMFKAIGMNSEDIKNQFGFFIKAFQYGVPPHAGIAFGLDRIIMILSNSESIRETIAFPKNAKGKSLMEEAPAFASENVLEEYGISVKDNK